MGRGAKIAVWSVGGVLAVAVLSIGACGTLLPTVNAPIAHLLFGSGVDVPPESVVETRMQVPPGYGIGIFAAGIPNARFLRMTARGDLLVSAPRSGDIYLVEADDNGDGQADGIRLLMSGLDRPHGLDLHDGWLYIGEGTAITRVRFDDDARATTGSPETVVAGLPEGGNHWTKTVRIGPDGWMYVSAGSSCNVCEEEDPQRAAMMRYRPDGSRGEIFATGLRNSVGFDFQPGTGALFATDNGRDLLGDDFPPCELNEIVEDGFYGWPVANGDRVPDPDFGAGQEARIAASIPPAHAFGSHTAPLGMTFVRGKNAPDGYRGAALVALHGSWNRSEKSGYRVVSLHWQDDGTIEERDFATGFEVDEDVIGRPVDVAEGPDGSFYISDDYAGAIWRVAPGANTAASTRPPASRRSSDTASKPDPVSGLSPAELADIQARGKDLYEANACAGCHEAARADEGVVPVPLRALSERYDIDSLVTFFAAPTPPMPTPPLDEAERRELAIYLLSTTR